MRIALDVMGSDNNPSVDVAGGVEAARQWQDDEIIMVGDQPRVQAELNEHEWRGLKISVVHAADQIVMTDKPRAVVRGKPESSMHVGMNLVKSGEADAFVTVGHTGSALAIAMLATLKRIEGVKRPSMGTIFPVKGNPLLVDSGANADCNAENLLQFAIMGSIYYTAMTGKARPSIGLVSNGEEEGKGNELVREATELLKGSSLNFIGNIEPSDFFAAQCDVSVADGFVGNILLKTAEATAKYLVSNIRTEIRSSVLSTVGGALARPALRRVADSLNPNKVGGVPLLGVNGVVIIGHGSSTSEGVMNAIGQARKGVEFGIVDAIRTGIERGGR